MDDLTILREVRSGNPPPSAQILRTTELQLAQAAAAEGPQSRSAPAGARLRARPRRVARLAAGAGLGLAAATGIFAAVALQPASPHPVTRTARLAAWTVIRQPDGLLKIHFRQLDHPAVLQARLRKDGVPARVQFVRHGWEATTSTHIIPRSCSLNGPSDKASALLADKILPTPGGPPNKQGIGHTVPGLALVIRPSAIPTGTGLFLQIGPSGFNTVLVRATRACTGP